jgi:hypothetical protein
VDFDRLRRLVVHQFTPARINGKHRRIEELGDGLSTRLAAVVGGDEPTVLVRRTVVAASV